MKSLPSIQGVLKVIAVVGPTASGKSALGAYLAKKVGGKVVSADSRQIYKGMRVISRAEKGYMVGVANPRKAYSAGQYARETKKVLERIMIYHNKIPVVVGGGGFYIDALLGRMSLPESKRNSALRKKLSVKTSAQLLSMLKKLDGASAKRVDPHNKERVIRAIEIATQLGKVPALTLKSPYTVLWLGIAPKASSHLSTIKKGVVARLEQGMVQEAKKLRSSLPKKRYAELGFEFDLLAQYLDKKISKPELVARLVNGERKYAKRQMRWFKRNKDIHWISSKAEALRLAKNFLH